MHQSRLRRAVHIDVVLVVLKFRRLRGRIDLTRRAECIGNAQAIDIDRIRRVVVNLVELVGKVVGIRRRARTCVVALLDNELPLKRLRMQFICKCEKDKQQYDDSFHGCFDV